MLKEDFLWVEKYRPKTVADTILPINLKSTFQKFIDQNNIPNLILSGPAGVGKTTVAKAMLEQLGCDYLVINGSLNGNIDTLRTEILNFASAVSLSGGRKYVILDEADYLNANSTQPALRNFMEEFAGNCGFILTCNFKNRIIQPLHSRCSIIDFSFSKEDLVKLGGEFFKRAATILNQENIGYDKSVLGEVILKYLPDWRRVLNELQRYSVSGNIDAGILSNLKDSQIKDAVKLMKDKDFTNLRKWVGENSDVDQVEFFHTFYKQADDNFQQKSIPELVLILSKYQYQAAFVADPEINIMACLTEIMISCEFK